MIKKDEFIRRFSRALFIESHNEFGVEYTEYYNRELSEIYNNLTNEINFICGYYESFTDRLLHFKFFLISQASEFFKKARDIAFLSEIEGMAYELARKCW